MAARVTRISAVDLEKMATGSLLARLRRLLACEESESVSYEGGTPCEPGIIQFKDDPDWAHAHTELKRVLAGREHLPPAAERAEKRRRRAMENTTKEKRR